mmetsp:Transcript_12045/g.39624  ORF Transcript_12045/g.39624 Transcript_12045/m.39624 type:complete len:202 (+) Transcript_12045:198-803(+)
MHNLLHRPLHTPSQLCEGSDLLLCQLEVKYVEVLSETGGRTVTLPRARSREAAAHVCDPAQCDLRRRLAVLLADHRARVLAVASERALQWRPGLHDHAALRVLCDDAGRVAVVDVSKAHAEGQLVHGWHCGALVRKDHVELARRKVGDGERAGRLLRRHLLQRRPLPTNRVVVGPWVVEHYHVNVVGGRGEGLEVLSAASR